MGPILHQNSSHSIVCLIRGSIAALTDSCFSFFPAAPPLLPCSCHRCCCCCNAAALQRYIHTQYLQLVFGRTRTAVTHNHRPEGRKDHSEREGSLLLFRSATLPPHVRLPDNICLYFVLVFHIILRPNAGRSVDKVFRLVHRSGKRDIKCSLNCDSTYGKRGKQESDSPGEALLQAAAAPFLRLVFERVEKKKKCWISIKMSLRSGKKRN